jgi:SAM-dependent methyltransferase
MVVNKLNLGCGGDHKKGYINLDWQPLTNPDVSHNLNTIPYPFDDNTFSHIDAFHVLEHLDRPFDVMKELHRILEPGGKLHIKVPHFSRGFTHSEHAHGFDITFPCYFNEQFIRSGYFGIDFELHTLKIHWMAFFHLLPHLGYGKSLISALRVINGFISFFANLSPALCSRLWCYWVGGFEEIEFIFICKK